MGKLPIDIGCLPTGHMAFVIPFTFLGYGSWNTFSSTNLRKEIFVSMKSGDREGSLHAYI
jgi:hypothetical protein